MKYSIPVKFMAVFLCALSLVAIIGGAFGILSAEEFGLYTSDPDAWRESEVFGIAHDLAYSSAQLYAAEHLGHCPDAVLEVLEENSITDASGNSVPDSIWSATISQDGKVLRQGDASLPDADVLYFQVEPYYPMVSSEAVEPNESEEAVESGQSDKATNYAATESIRQDITSDRQTLTASRSEWSDYVVVQDSPSKMRTVRLDYYAGPTYDVTLYLQSRNVSTRFDSLTAFLFDWRFSFIIFVLTGLLLFAASLVYLCWAAGKKAGTSEIIPAALNRIPLDLYAVCAVGGCVLFCLPLQEIYSYLSYSATASSLWLSMVGSGLCVFAAALLAVGFFFAFSAQIKMKDGFWWRHSICGWCLRMLARFFRWAGHGIYLAGRGCRAVFRLLPIIWQWLLVALLMAVCTLISLLLWASGAPFFFITTLICACACIAIVCYGGYCFGTLMKGAKAMAQGNLNRKIPTGYLLGSFRDFAIQLNSLADAAQKAAERQMKSERMKTELITNVSHDIKTPLTSIINYVDLLKKPHTDSDGALYLEVLDRQSQRLKKLIDDLMEMSKASTGSLPVEITRVDAAEAINQALGEFSDKLASVNLTPVFRCPDAPVVMLADGRLLWRVLSNLLSNAVKYAMPDTRLYLDLILLQGNAVITIKNISRDQLNVPADELMERFVRGDTSRNTEGSGLGLNIAKSLVELQHGQMHLMVDGDLFKVTLIFPCA